MKCMGISLFCKQRRYYFLTMIKSVSICYIYTGDRKFLVQVFERVSNVYKVVSVKVWNSLPNNVSTIISSSH